MNHSSEFQNVQYPNNFCLNAFLTFKNEIENKIFKKDEINHKHPYERFLEEHFKNTFIEKEENKEEEKKKGEAKEEEEKKGEAKEEEEKKEEAKEDEAKGDEAKEDEEKMDIEKEEEIKEEKNVKKIMKVKNKKKITRKMIKNPQILNSLEDQLQMAANTAYDIYEKKNFLSALKKKIDEATEEDFIKQNQSILNDYKNNITFIQNILKLNNN